MVSVAGQLSHWVCGDREDSCFTRVLSMGLVSKVTFEDRFERMKEFVRMFEGRSF